MVIADRDGRRERVDLSLGGCPVATHPPHKPKVPPPATRKDLARRAGYTGTVN